MGDMKTFNETVGGLKKNHLEKTQEYLEKFTMTYLAKDTVGNAIYSTEILATLKPLL